MVHQDNLIDLNMTAMAPFGMDCAPEMAHQDGTVLPIMRSRVNQRHLAGFDPLGCCERVSLPGYDHRAEIVAMPWLD